MKKMSMTVGGLAVVILSAILRLSGVEIVDEEVQHVVNLALEVGGIVVAWYGRYRQGDISPVGVKSRI